MTHGYDHREIEPAARKKWTERGLYRCDLADESKEPYYLLVEFPYPSGDLHIGHWYAFAVTDIYARMLRARGKNVLFPIGFDAFGLPAENAAIKHGIDPAEWTKKNIERMRTQLESMGPSFDWSKEVITYDPAYYQWTQWLFTKLFEHGLAERRKAAVKWCPQDQTVLANEQVIDGCCERCGSPVEEKELTQWFLKITDYAERLLSGLDKLPWRTEIKEAQRAWIGKSEGAYLTFPVVGREEKIRVFTTRPDTVFGATYVVLAPEHPLVAMLAAAAKNKPAIDAYVAATKQKTERERSENKEKTGVPLDGISAVNPATEEEIPVYVADYVLGSYGTGAVMAVPAHDERDYAFAAAMRLPVKEVVVPLRVDKRNPPIAGKPSVERRNVHVIVRNPKDGKVLILKWKKHPWTTFPMGGIEEGETVLEAARREVLEETGYKNLVNGKVWGGQVRAEYFAAHKDQNRVSYTSLATFDLADEERQSLAAEEDEAHGVLWADMKDLTTTSMTHAEMDIWLLRLGGASGAYVGSGVLIASGDFSGRASDEAMQDIVAATGGERATQYRLRDWLVSRQRYWGCPIPIAYDPDGKPHAIPAEHLPWMLPTDVDFTPTGKAPLASSKELQARVEKIFGTGWTPEYDTLDTFVDSSWYFLRYLDPKDAHNFSDRALMEKWMPVDRYSGGSEHTTLHLLYARFFTKALYDLALVPVDEPFTERFNRGLIMGPDGQKMSKSKGNVINPDDFVEKYGADAVRIYLAFIGPYNEPGSYPWQLDGVASMRKFLERVVRLADRASDTPAPKELQRAAASAASKIALDGDRFKFNTGIAALMTLLNELEASPAVPRAAAADFIVMLAPFAPHLAENLWEKLGGEGSVHETAWPFKEFPAESNQPVTVVVQVNGRRRGAIELAPDASETDAVAAATALAPVAAALGDAAPARVIYMPGKIINLVGK
ncbi:MAG TPA: class I tRNA ligase family protein [Candidatus Paceibacterota bacterium]|nr:class I tRNA ligase family protein [Candidatus Paceibacterota bacterium]